jgi:hypothetical protein
VDNGSQITDGDLAQPRFYEGSVSAETVEKPFSIAKDRFLGVS